LDGLKLEHLAIGSLPHKSVDSAMALVRENFTIPFCPQMVRLNKNEDMIIQYTENMPAFFSDEESGKFWLETESDEFFAQMEEFFEDYAEIEARLPGSTEAKLSKYAISADYYSGFAKFLEIVRTTKPAYAKAQIVGPFTLASTLVDKAGRCAIYDDTLKEIIIKTLSLKALWQIEEIKGANPANPPSGGLLNGGTVPIIFIDEPSISQLGTSAFLTISSRDVTEMLKEVSDVIQTAGALSAIHCCGKCDWSVVLNSGVNIINLDAYTYAQNLSVFGSDVEKFLKNGGKIAWGVVPTLDKNALHAADLDKMINVFEAAVKYLTGKGIDEKMIIDNSLISPTCGAGGLSEELAEKAMRLTRQVSDFLKEKYSGS
jgi:hypothetical protein